MITLIVKLRKIQNAWSNKNVFSQTLLMIINLFETWCFQELIHFWNSVFTFVFVKLCDAFITHAATEKPYRADHRDTVPLIRNAQYTIKILVPIEKKI